MTEQDRAHKERLHDEAVEDSFPASDPPANSGIVGPRGPHEQGRPAPHKQGRPAPHKRNEDERPKGTPTHDRHAAETAHVWENEEHPPGQSAGPPKKLD